MLTAMAYTLLKMHRKTLLKLGMDEILQFLQVTAATHNVMLSYVNNWSQVRLEHDFGYDDDTVINNLRECMEELKKSKLDYSGSPPSHELPQKPFGLFSPPPLAQQVA